MDKEDEAILFELPDNLRNEVRECAMTTGISVDWLVSLYRRGYNVKLGPTGERPYGKLGADDEGELTVAVGVDAKHGVIRMEFGKPTAWLALPSLHARRLGKILVQRADELDRKLS